MPTIAVSVRRIWSCPKRSLDYALGDYTSDADASAHQGDHVNPPRREHAPSVIFQEECTERHPVGDVLRASDSPSRDARGIPVPLRLASAVRPDVTRSTIAACC